MAVNMRSRFVKIVFLAADPAHWWRLG